MEKRTYTILDRKTRENGVVFTIFVDDTDGFADFEEALGASAAPGSTVDIADLKCVMRLRHDGQWERLSSYAASEAEAEELENAAAEAILAEVLSAEDDTAESEDTQ